RAASALRTRRRRRRCLPWTAASRRSTSTGSRRNSCRISPREAVTFRPTAGGITMKAAVLGTAGIEVADVDKPAPKSNEVLIRVRASTLNRADLIVASGRRHGATGGAGARIGLECAGEVEAVGSDVKGLAPGDRVMATGPGGIAEYAVTDAGRVH